MWAWVRIPLLTKFSQLVKWQKMVLSGCLDERNKVFCGFQLVETDYF